MTKVDQSASDQLLHTHHIFRAHQELLEDAVRNRAFYSALRKQITGDSTVLDIGAGTGLWAIAAAKLGAKRVVAIERDELLAALIGNLAKENQVGNRVEIVRGDSREITLGRDFDVIISETIGNLGFDEQIVPILIDARKRFLKRGGVLIPASVALTAAPAHLRKRSKRIPAGVPLAYSYFEALNLNISIMLKQRSDLRLISEPRELIRVDFDAIKKPPELRNLTASWKLSNASDINCIAVWAQATLTEGVELSALDAASWQPIVYMLRPFKKDRGEFEFQADLSEKSNYWTASLLSKGERETQSYSPVLVYVALQGHMRG
jgi:protein arginine N-methyltransferase 1